MVDKNNRNCSRRSRPSSAERHTSSEFFGLYEEVEKDLELEKLEKLKKIIIEEKEKFLENPDNKIRSQLSIHNELGISRHIIKKVAKIVVGDEDLYSKIWYKRKIPSDKLNALEVVINIEKEKFLKNSNYSPPSLNTIGEKLGINPVPVGKWTRNFMKNDDLYHKMWHSYKKTSEEKLNNLKLIVKKELNRFKNIPNYKTPSLTMIGDRLGMGRKVVAKWIQRFIKNEKLYHKMWPSYEKKSDTSKENLGNLKNTVLKEIDKFNNIPNYRPTTFTKIGENLNVNRKIVAKWAFKIVDSQDLYDKMWVQRENVSAHNYKKELKLSIYEELRFNHKNPNEIDIKDLLMELGNQYINDENILLGTKYLFIIYYLMFSKFGTYEITRRLTFIFVQTVVSLRSITLKILNLLKKEINDFKRPNETDTLTIDNFEKYLRRCKSKKSTQEFLEFNF